MQNLWMKLDCIELLFGTLSRRDRTVCRMCRNTEMRRLSGYIIEMAHPAYRFLRHIFKQLRCLIYNNLCLSILADLCPLHFSSQYKHHDLCPIAEPQHRDSHLKQFFRAGWGIRLIAAVRSSGQDDSFGIHLSDLFQICLIRIYLAVHVTLSDTPCRQLVILPAKIKNNYQLSLHLYSSSFVLWTLYNCCILPFSAEIADAET